MTAVTWSADSLTEASRLSSHISASSCVAASTRRSPSTVISVAEAEPVTVIVPLIPSTATFVLPAASNVNEKGAVALNGLMPEPLSSQPTVRTSTARRPAVRWVPVLVLSIGSLGVAGPIKTHYGRAARLCQPLISERARVRTVPGRFV